MWIQWTCIVFLVYLILEATSHLSSQMMQQIYGKRMSKRIKMKNCSIHKSSIVRQTLSTDFFPIFQKYGVDVPLKCRLHKDRDIFTWIEGNKSNSDGFSTKCEICGKEFYEQYHFYEHAMRKHSEFFFQGKTAVCLADYCDMFRCDLHEKYPYNIPSKIDCDKKNVDKLRRTCEYLMRSCLPEKMFHHVYDQLYMAICSTLTCEKFLHPFQDSVSITTVVALSIAIPISLFFLGQIVLICYDNMDSVAEDEKYLRAQRARYEARNAEYNARFYGLRNRGIETRHRRPFSYNQFGSKHRYSIVR